MKNILKKAIEGLLRNERIPLNHVGAVGWVYGDNLWVVSKRFLYELRQYCLECKIQGIPRENYTLINILEAEGLIETDGDCHSVHTKQVGIDSTFNTFTLLCLPLKNIWTNHDDCPPQVEGISVT